MLLVEISTLSRSGLLGLGVGALILALPYRGYLRSRALLAPLAGVLGVLAVVIVTRLHFFEVVIRRASRPGHASQSAHFQVYSFIPKILHSHPLFGLGLNNFSLYYQAVTGQDELGPALLLRLADRRDGARRDDPVRRVPDLGVRPAPRGSAARQRARARPRPARRPGSTARLGLDGGARRDDGLERLLPDDAVLLLLRLPGARARGPARLRARALGGLPWPHRRPRARRAGPPGPRSAGRPRSAPRCVSAS